MDRLGYAITPRFAPSCTERQLAGAGELAQKYPDVWIQSHVAENLDEIRWARSLFPRSSSYLAVYDDFGLMRERAIYAHCIHFDDDDRALMRDTGVQADHPEFGSRVSTNGCKLRGSLGPGCGEQPWHTAGLRAPCSLVLRAAHHAELHGVHVALV